ncbi:MAG TPA: CehA/McbA family metallohydrolase [Steroidobacteraceae bacterium]|nr:CehA/McbA family metallohydrolase [Steroidobacteraceae bacterium]
MATALPLAVLGAREPVLKQVDVPHSYYWRELYIPQPTTGPSAAAFAPDGREVVYSMAGSLWQQAIGSDAARELTHGPGYDLQPDWSRDGRSIVFVRYHDDAMELWRLELATGRQRALTSAGAVNVEPRLSPDGRQLLYVSTQGTGHFNLFIADIDERGLANARHLVPPRESKLDRYYYSSFDHAINPSWSADGERVFYVGNPEVAWGSGDIWSVAVRAPEDRRRVLADESTWAARPELSPDGRRLLYSSYQGRQWHQLWLTTPDGRSPLPLTFGEFDRRNARWSPDGQRVLYVSNETGNTSLWVHDTIGGKRVPVVARKRQYLRGMATLSVTLRDERGQPLSGRVMVLADDGRYYAPDEARLHGDDSFDRSGQRQENRYFHCSDHCSLTVPAGTVKLTVMSGFERLPVEHDLAIPAAGREMSVRLAPQTLPQKFGEHTSADLHVHMNYGGHYRQQLAGLAAQAQAEDLDVVYNLIVNKEQRIPDVAEFATGPRQIGPTTIFQAQEFHTSYWGHLALLHLEDHLLLPDFGSYRHTALGSPYPHNGAIADLAHEQHALVGYVHPYDWRIEPDKEKSLTHALPVDVALGKVDYLEVVSFADPRATAEVWYRLLNLGFRLPAAAGTDAMTNYASLRGPVGLNRIYLATSDRSPAALGAAVRAGRGFATNAPLLGLRVEGAAPGDTVQLAPGQRSVRVEAAVRSIVPLSDIELVLNGRVVRRLRADRSGRLADFEGEVGVPASGWLLLRAAHTAPHALVQDLYPYGTTNPVWIEAATPPPAAAEDARYFVRWIDRMIAAASTREDYDTDRQREQTLTYLQAARAIFTTRAATNGTGFHD